MLGTPSAGQVHLVYVCASLPRWVQVHYLGPPVPPCEAERANTVKALECIDKSPCNLGQEDAGTALVLRGVHDRPGRVTLCLGVRAVRAFQNVVCIGWHPFGALALALHASMCVCALHGCRGCVHPEADQEHVQGARGAGRALRLQARLRE